MLRIKTRLIDPNEQKETKEYNPTPFRKEISPSWARNSQVKEVRIRYGCVVVENKVSITTGA